MCPRDLLRSCNTGVVGSIRNIAVQDSLIKRFIKNLQKTAQKKSQTSVAYKKHKTTGGQVQINTWQKLLNRDRRLSGQQKRKKTLMQAGSKPVNTNKVSAGESDMMQEQSGKA